MSVGVLTGLLDNEPFSISILFQDVLNDRRATSLETLRNLIPNKGDLVVQNSNLQVVSWRIHLGRNVSDSSTVSIAVRIGPFTLSSSVSGSDSDLHDGIEGKVVFGRVSDAASRSRWAVGKLLFLIFGPQDVHGNLAVNTVENGTVLEVFAEVAVRGGLPLSSAVLDFDIVRSDDRAVVSGFLEGDLQFTLLRLDGSFCGRNLGRNSSGLNLVGLIRELTPSPSVAASDLVVHELSGIKLQVHVKAISGVEEFMSSDKLLPVRVGVEIGRTQRSGALDVPKVVALDGGASVDVISNRVPLELNGRLGFFSASHWALHRSGNLLNSSGIEATGAVAGELSPSLGVSSSDLSLDELSLILSVKTVEVFSPESAHGKSAAFRLNDSIKRSVTESLLFLE